MADSSPRHGSWSWLSVMALGRGAGGVSPHGEEARQRRLRTMRSLSSGRASRGPVGIAGRTMRPGRVAASPAADEPLRGIALKGIYLKSPRGRQFVDFERSASAPRTVFPIFEKP